MSYKDKIIKIRLLDKEISVQLLPFRHEGNEEYFLLDTGCILDLLPRLRSLVDRIEKKGLKLAIMEHNIKEVEIHLKKLLEEKEEKTADTSGPRSGMEGFRRLLESDRIRKIADPEKQKKDEPLYKEFSTDGPLIHALRDGNFKGIAVQEAALLRKIKEKAFRCEQLLKS